jgi:hypothetical protein
MKVCIAPDIACEKKEEAPKFNAASKSEKSATAVAKPIEKFKESTTKSKKTTTKFKKSTTTTTMALTTENVEQFFAPKWRAPRTKEERKASPRT